MGKNTALLHSKLSKTEKAGCTTLLHHPFTPHFYIVTSHVDNKNIPFWQKTLHCYTAVLHRSLFFAYSFIAISHSNSFCPTFLKLWVPLTRHYTHSPFQKRCDTTALGGELPASRGGPFARVVRRPPLAFYKKKIPDLLVLAPKLGHKLHCATPPLTFRGPAPPTSSGSYF